MKILVTGGTGYIGKALLAKLTAETTYEVSGTTRSQHAAPSVAPLIPVGDCCATTDWSAALQGVDVVVHVAAHLKTPTGPGISQLDQLWLTNVEGTLALAQQALAAGVKRFIFISSVGVNGSHTTHAPFTEESVPAPEDDYARSKLEAERGLMVLLADTSMEFVIIRPPLVYAAHAPRNFPRLLQWVASGVPMPFALINNKRSMIALENLVDFLALCIAHPAAANELFLVSDGLDMSTSQIVSELATSMGGRARLLPVPDWLMRWGARMVGKQSMYSTLCASLVVDSSKAQQLLNWTPPLTAREALLKSGQEFRLRDWPTPLSQRKSSLRDARSER
ncbi:NAD-dependent dehydratase [Pseudomonas syringae]|uniref:NAD-dependent dehydratase n=2 Tax=Pseudomonas syringae TaxID=317 RepID=A0A1C7Z6Q7_PSESX|nr:NAD-dependent dehydratase [Pseudomonas syringae]